MKSILFLICLFFLNQCCVEGSNYGINAVVSGSFTVNGNSQFGSSSTTTKVSGSFSVPEIINIGLFQYQFPSSAPTSTSQVLTASTTSEPFALTWSSMQQQQVTLSTDISSTGTSIIINGSAPSLTVAGIKANTGISVSGPTNGDIIIGSTISVTQTTGSTGTTLVGSSTSPNFQINGVKAGSGISISGPTNGDVTFASTIIQTTVVFPVTSHPTGIQPNSQTFPWPGWTSLVPSLSTSTAPSSCVIYGSGANNVNCDLTNNSGTGTPQCVAGNNNDLSFTSANPVARNTCSSTFTNTLAGSAIQTLSLTCSGNMRSIMLICTI